jgi:hypothetical protein
MRFPRGVPLKGQGVALFRTDFVLSWMVQPPLAAMTRWILSMLGLLAHRPADTVFACEYGSSL